MARRAGFTLIEVSIAVFIIAMLMAVSIPTFVRSYNSAVLNETVRAYATLCQYGRIQAVREQSPATLHLDLDRQVIWLTQRLANDDGAGGETTIKAHEVNPRVLLVAVERADAPGRVERTTTLSFHPNGTCDAATVVFRGAEKTGLAATLDPITCKAKILPVRL
jgi:prepilin-type N-terminal cleavage/methylation domain-containing protein